ncbi:hypothetical protein C8Q80DRAFT_1114829 [Daedaleopsis nitida]|nr:hypothetical protein C8Q80DRAFT_1114829 [Daedaleopsis nitida]
MATLAPETTSEPAAGPRTIEVQVRTSSKPPISPSTTTNAAASGATDASGPTAAPAWPTDNVWLTFPPFPQPPPGVDIVPFKDFKPAGIFAAEDPSATTEREIDGLGIPTVPLRVRHSLTGKEKMKRKKKSNTVGPGGLIMRQAWYEEWAELEYQRRLTAPIDPSLPRIDRLHLAASEFKSGRALQTLQDLNRIWDHFRVFTGLLSSVKPAASRKKVIDTQPDDGEDDGDEEDEMPNAGPPKERTIPVVESTPMDAATVLPKPNVAAHSPELTQEEREHRREYFLEVRDTKTDRFLNDPENCIKIFLSGYFRDRGLMFSEKICRDGPILIAFFLNFLLRNRVFPEMEKDLKKAVAVAELARTELPHTFVISRVAPDAFSKGCESLFGVMTHSTWWAHEEPEQADASEDEREAKRQKVEQAEGEAAFLQEAAGEAEIEVITPDTMRDMEQEMKEVHADANVNGEADAPAWGESAGSFDWGAPDDTADDWGTGPTESPLAPYLGPTTLPLTHTTGIVERSTRRIKSVEMPPKPNPQQRKKSKIPVDTAPLPDAAGVEHELDAKFAKMTLVPWHEWDLYETADVRKPRLLPNSRGAAVADDGDSAEPGAHNPFKDELTVYIEPTAAAEMKVGMGVEASWVQLARVDPAVPIAVDPETFNNAWLQRQKREVGGPGVPVAPTKVWYLEQIIAVLPSFHTETIPLPTVEEVFGGEAA